MDLMESNNKNILKAALVLILLFAGIPAQAAIQSLSIEEQRALFIKTENALEHDTPENYKKLKARLGNYPLIPYLHYAELKKNISSLKSDQAEAFFALYKDTPLAEKFRREWLKELADRKQWWTYRVFYKPGKNVKLHCHNLNALIQTGATEKALKQVPKVWLSGKSQPKACDPVFKSWQDAGNLTDSLAWQRIELAMNAGNLSLANYLSRFLNSYNKRWYDYWVKVHKQPATHLDLTKTANTPVDVATIWIHGIKRLARTDIDKALTVWKRHKTQKVLSNQQQYQLERYLILKQLSKDRVKAAPLLAAFNPSPEDHHFIEKRLRFGISEKNWQAVLNWIDASPAIIKNKERWRYWQAYSLKKINRADEAEKIFREASKQRSYHGFLAADELNADYNLNNTPLLVPAKLLTKISNSPSILRSRELLALNRYIDARREWYWATRDMPHDQLQAAAKIAQSWNWHDQAIFTLAKTKYWEDLELRFPVKHQEQVNRNATSRQLDSAWIFAVIRQESAFGHDARSHAGALGLMQLMPRTAKFVAKKLKHKRPAKKDLLTPLVNIKLGTAYLREVLDQLGDHQVLATAAYNAGPHRVKSWLPEKPLAANLWIESIPFKETRTYTERVMTYAVIYEQRLGKTLTRLNQRMSPVQPNKIITMNTVISVDNPAL